MNTKKFNLNFGFIGTGNGGNQVINDLYKAGLHTYDKYVNMLAINSSEKDLGKIDPEIIHMKIGQHGCAKERTFAKDYIKSSHEEILSDPSLNELIQNSDVIFLISSTGGGTGSGKTPILTAMLKKQYEKKIFINIGIFPDNSDDYQAFKNSFEYLKEINSIDFRLMPYSNGKAEGRSLSDRQKYINAQIVADIKALMGYYSIENDDTMIDERDNIKLLNTKGIIKVTRVPKLTEKMLDEKSFDQILISAMKKAPYVDLDKDKIQPRIGFITNLTMDVNRRIDPEYPEFKEEYGEPKEIFKNYAIIEDEEIIELEDENIPAVTLIQSGLQLPNVLIDEFYRKTEKMIQIDAAEKTIKTDRFDILGQVKGSGVDISDTSVDKPGKINKADMKDIIGQF